MSLTEMNFTSNTTLDFVLSELNISASGANAVLISSSDSTSLEPGVSLAIFHVALSQMKGLFGFHSDGIDVDNILTTDILTTVNYHLPNSENFYDMGANKIFDGFMKHSLVTDGSHLSTPGHNELQSIPFDYVRNKAVVLFKTASAVDLFLNETEQRLTFIKSAVEQLHLTLLSLHNLGIQTIDSTNPNPSLKLLKSLITIFPERFSNMSTFPTFERENVSFFQLPFQENDSITIKVTGSTQQKQLDNLTPIPDKPYYLKLILVNSGATSPQAALSSSTVDFNDMKYLYEQSLKATPIDLSDVEYKLKQKNAAQMAVNAALAYEQSRTLDYTSCKSLLVDLNASLVLPNAFSESF
jgi:hypothetical protein